MTKFSHAITAIGMTAVIFWMDDRNIIDLQALLLGDALLTAWMAYVLFGVGSILGSSSPDWLELARYDDDQRSSLVKHRTLTHWMPLWILLGWSETQLHMIVFPYGSLILFGFIYSAMIHIIFDALSNSGVPFLTPYGKGRIKIPLYSTGKLSEYVVLSLFVSTLTALYVTQGN
jgi:inner membrane protein